MCCLTTWTWWDHIFYPVLRFLGKSTCCCLAHFKAIFQKLFESGYPLSTRSFTLKGCLFAGVKLVDSDKYLNTGYSTGFNSRLEFLLPDSSVSKSVHIDNKKRYLNSC